MSTRPLGIILVCAFFGLAGLQLSLGGVWLISMSASADPSSQPVSVQWFIRIMPILTLVIGVTALYVAAALWTARPSGRRIGMAWIVVWLAQEVLVGLWGLTGPEIVQEASSGLGGNLVRLGIGVVIFHYLWTTGAEYITERSATSAPSTISRGHS